MDVKQDVDYIERNPIASRRQLHPLRGHECNGKASAKRSKRESHEKKKNFFFLVYSSMSRYSINWVC